MSLPRLLDCATTMLYEEFQRGGASVFDAFDYVRQWSEGKASVAVSADAAAEEEHVPDAAENTRSMSEFMSLLGGIGGMPG